MIESSLHAVTFRAFREDDAPALTALLHRAYAALAERGLRYWATHQSEDDTVQRASRGECTVAELEGVLVGTICVIPSAAASGSPWYDRADVATFGQFGVAPEYQCAGLGSTLLAGAEARAAETGARELACDTAEEALGLIAWYTRRGYRAIEPIDHRPFTNYRSVVLSKSL